MLTLCVRSGSSCSLVWNLSGRSHTCQRCKTPEAQATGWYSDSANKWRWLCILWVKTPQILCQHLLQKPISFVQRVYSGDEEVSYILLLRSALLCFCLFEEATVNMVGLWIAVFQMLCFSTTQSCCGKHHEAGNQSQTLLHKLWNLRRLWSVTLP